MSASQLMSPGEGSLSHPVTGDFSPHMFLSRTTIRVMSKCADDSEEGTAGYNLVHCIGLTILFFLSHCMVVLFLAKTVWRFPGAWILSNLSLRAWEPTSTNRRQSLAKLVVSFVDVTDGGAEAIWTNQFCFLIQNQRTVLLLIPNVCWNGFLGCWYDINVRVHSRS